MPTAIEYHREGELVDKEWFCCELCVSRERKALVNQYEFTRSGKDEFFRSDDEMLATVVTNDDPPLLEACASCQGVRFYE